MAHDHYYVREDILRQIQNDMAEGNARDYTTLFQNIVHTAIRHKEQVDVLQSRNTELVEENRRLRAKIEDLSKPQQDIHK